MNTTRKKHKKHKVLQMVDRIRIDVLYRHKTPVAEIAEEIGVCRATIYNELKRSTYIHTNPDLTEEVRYNPEGAQRLADWNNTAKGPKLKIDKDHALAAFIEDKIYNKKYSPRSVLDYIEHHPDECQFSVQIKSPNTIYHYIDMGLFLKLERRHLPCGEKRKRKRKGEKERKTIVHRKSPRDRIDKRPEEVETRETFGHWEMDTVKSGEGDLAAALVLTERKTTFEIVEPLRRGTADEVRKALNRIERDIGSSFFKMFKTVTCDNGAEFAKADDMDKALYRVGKRFDLYYCHPYSAWERGQNENNNKLIRRHVKKGEDFGAYTRKQIKDIQEWVNTYPRPKYNGKSAKDMFIRELRQLHIEYALPGG